MKVPFVDLQAQYKTIKKEVDVAVHQVLDTSAYVLGPAVFNFEEEFAKYVGAKHVVCVSSGTAALEVALRAYDIGPGDEVIIPANTFFATAEAVSLVGATPVLADIEEETFNVQAGAIEKRITEKTKAIIPVDLYGQSVDLDPILELGKKHSIPIIEDAAQAHGTLYKNKRVGGAADIGCFSFYPGKNLGTYGEGGAVVTSSDELAEKMRMLRDHGGKVKYQHEIVGGNFRMSGIEGAVLGVKLPYLDSWNKQRRESAELYKKLLSDVKGVVLPNEPEYSVGNYHLFVIRVQDREKFQEFLEKKEIQNGIHYPVPIHLHRAYKNLGLEKGSFPISEKTADEIVSLPMYPELTNEQVAYVCDSIKEFFK